MANSASPPPSDSKLPTGEFFSGGMMPAAAVNTASMIIFDLRSLKLSYADAQDIEKALRDTLTQELTNRNLIQNRTATDLSGTIFGAAID